MASGISFGQYRFTDSYRGFTQLNICVSHIVTRPHWSWVSVFKNIFYSTVSAKEIYGFLKKARGNHLNNNSQTLFDRYYMSEGEFDYVSNFSGNLAGLLQIEEITYRGILVCRQVTSGRLSQ